MNTSDLMLSMGFLLGSMVASTFSLILQLSLFLIGVVLLVSGAFNIDLNNKK